MGDDKGAIRKMQAVDLFLGHPEWLDEEWTADDVLTANEIERDFFERAPMGRLIDVAHAFNCIELAKAGRRFSRESLLECVSKGNSQAADRPVETSDVEHTPALAPVVGDGNLLPEPFVNAVGKIDLDGVLSDTSRPAVLLMWSRNCSHCLRAKPGIIQAAKELRGKANFVAVEFPFPMVQTEIGPLISLNVADLAPNVPIAMDYEISGFSTILILKHDGEKWNREDLQPEGGQTLGNALRAYFGLPQEGSPSQAPLSDE